MVDATATALREIGVELRRIRTFLQVAPAGTELHIHVAGMQRRLESLQHALIAAFVKWQTEGGLLDDLSVVLDDWEAARLWWI